MVFASTNGFAAAAGLEPMSLPGTTFRLSPTVYMNQPPSRWPQREQMTSLNLDDIDKRLINLVQAEFPLTVEPYTDLGLRLGIDRDSVIRRIARLKARRIVRLIGPVLDARSLGYQTTLVAMRVAKEHQDKAEQIIAEHPGVSHGYERGHYFNLWFTLAVPAETGIETELTKLTSTIKAEAVFSLPAVKVFKIGAYFDMYEGGEGTAGAAIQSGGELPGKADLSREDKMVIRELEQDLPLVPRPFTAMANELGMAVEDFLAACVSQLQCGVMRRFGASINHSHAGYRANAMACWVAPPDKVGAVGRRLALLPEVSHCYERTPHTSWPYNLFAVVHSRTRARCQELVRQISAETGLADCVVLFSTREFKKTRIKYLL